MENLNKLKSFQKDTKFKQKQGKEYDTEKVNKLESQNRKLERQRNELFTVFKKQLKLIEVII